MKWGAGVRVGPSPEFPVFCSEVPRFAGLEDKGTTSQTLLGSILTLVLWSQASLGLEVAEQDWVTRAVFNLAPQS